MSLCRSVGARYSMTRDASGMVVVWDHQERGLSKPLPHERTSAATVTISSSLAHDGLKGLSGRVADPNHLRDDQRGSRVKSRTPTPQVYDLTFNMNLGLPSPSDSPLEAGPCCWLCGVRDRLAWRGESPEGVVQLYTYGASARGSSTEGSVSVQGFDKTQYVSNM